MPAFQFNTQGIDPHYGGGGAGLPAQVGGQNVRHPVVISGSALKPTKDGQGGYLELTITAIDGPSKGVEQIDRLNLQNKSAEAVRIANQQLAAYCAVMGVFSFNATEELHNKPFLLETKPRSDNPNTFEVAKLYDINGNEPGKAGAGAPAGQQTGGFGQQPPPQQSGGGFNAGGGQQQTPPPADQQQQQGGGQPGWAGNNGGGQQQQQQGGWNQGGQQGAAPASQPGWGQR
jgi:hypothetical protein